MACTSGTAVVHVALLSVGLRGTKEKTPKVAIPDYTCQNVASSVVYAGCEPVFIDVEMQTLGMSIESLKSVEKKVKLDGVLVAHSYGFIAKDIDEIRKFCNERKIPLIEDASEAHGAVFNGRVAGQFGDVAAFSVRSEKMIGVGEGGVVTTNDPEIAEKVFYWINDGRVSEKVRYWVTAPGFNFHMGNVAGAIGLAQVEQFETIKKKKQEIGRLYNALFKPITDQGYLIPMRKLNGSQPVYWLNCFMLGFGIHIAKEDLIRILDERGIECRPAFYRMSMLPPYENGYLRTSGENSSYVSKELIAFPSNVYMEKEDIERVLKEFKEVCGID